MVKSRKNYKRSLVKSRKIGRYRKNKRNNRKRTMRGRGLWPFTSSSKHPDIIKLENELKKLDDDYDKSRRSIKSKISKVKESIKNKSTNKIDPILEPEIKGKELGEEYLREREKKKEERREEEKREEKRKQKEREEEQRKQEIILQNMRDQEELSRKQSSQVKRPVAAPGLFEGLTDALTSYI